MRPVFLILLTLLTSVSSAAPAPGGLIRVHFAHGRSEATLTGRMTARDIASDYVVAARKGQRMTVRIESSRPQVELTVLGPNVYLSNSDRVRAWTGRLPASGDYIFRVTAPHPMAFVYTLQIKVSALTAAPPSANPSLVPADAALTGSFDRGEYGDLDVQALPGGRVHFRLIAFGVIHAPGGPNIGEAEDILTLHRGVGIYTAPEGKGHLILRFMPHRVVITQQGVSSDLDFGMSVDASGVYKKNSSRTPKFDPKDH